MQILLLGDTPNGRIEHAMSSKQRPSGAARMDFQCELLG